MQTFEFDYTYPNELIGLEPSRPSRVAFCQGQKPPVELTIETLLTQFEAGDVLVINDSKVIPARVFTATGEEILFLSSVDTKTWDVLFAARDFKVGAVLYLPGGIEATLEQKGLPQKLKSASALAPEYFTEHGELAVPPYIQDVRGERHNRKNEREWYQTAWAERRGSVAAPTASLHFTNEHLQQLKDKGVNIARLTLHVGAGTFMPIRGENLEGHAMHSERVEIPTAVVEQLEQKRGRVWALGTTVARALESLAAGHLERQGQNFCGNSKLFIYPPYQFKTVDILLTNFHQPRSTLLCLVAAFAGLERVKDTYQWAIEKKFKLFSYGDLTVWTR